MNLDEVSVCGIEENPYKHLGGANTDFFISIDLKATGFSQAF
jgi:hypothetical protein